MVASRLRRSRCGAIGRSIISIKPQGSASTHRIATVNPIRTQTVLGLYVRQQSSEDDVGDWLVIDAKPWTDHCHARFGDPFGAGNSPLNHIHASGHAIPRH
jgi:hypothetical protein